MIGIRAEIDLSSFPLMVCSHPVFRRSFGLNHYGTKWATGKIVERGQVSGFQFFGAGVEQVAEKDGVPIGRRGHNGHPYTGQSGHTQRDAVYR
jgi:hypothetical protein